MSICLYLNISILAQASIISHLNYCTACGPPASTLDPFSLFSNFSQSALSKYKSISKLISFSFSPCPTPNFKHLMTYIKEKIVNIAFGLLHGPDHVFLSTVISFHAALCLMTFWALVHYSLWWQRVLACALPFAWKMLSPTDPFVTWWRILLALQISVFLGQFCYKRS